VSRALRCKVCLGLTTGFLKGANAAEMGSRAYAAQHARGWTTSKMTGKTSTKIVCSLASPRGATSPGSRCKVCAGLNTRLRRVLWVPRYLPFSTLFRVHAVPRSGFDPKRCLQNNVVLLSPSRAL
jgi:hypothetical protein